MEKFNEFLNEQFKDLELKSVYDLLEAEFVKLRKRIDKLIGKKIRIISYVEIIN